MGLFFKINISKRYINIVFTITHYVLQDTYYRCFVVHVFFKKIII